MYTEVGPRLDQCTRKYTGYVPESVPGSLGPIELMPRWTGHVVELLYFTDRATGAICATG
jgi:hypothetical protein